MFYRGLRRLYQYYPKCQASVVCGTFTAGRSRIETGNGKLTIIQDGPIRKFTKQVQQITFASDIARKNNKSVLYITERAVFRLAAESLELIEIAPGVDLEKDILSQMDFKPQISVNLKRMDARIFYEQAMDLKIEVLYPVCGKAKIVA